MNNTNTIQEAKDFLKEGFEKGVECPCCKQYVRKYRRLFDSGLARFLLGLYNLSKGSVTAEINKDDIRALMEINKLQATNYGIIEYWKLAEPVKNDDPKKRTSGLWKITALGIAFAEDKINIPKYCFTYNNKRLGFDEETTTIRHALGRNFNYEELMNYGK